MRTRTSRMATIIGIALPAEAYERLWEALGAFSPAVEGSLDDPGHFVLDAAGVSPRYGDEAGWARAVLAAVREQGGIRARLGIASSRFAAEVAAQAAPTGAGYRIVSGPDARFLAPLPVEFLPLTPEALRRLRLLGLSTMGRLAALSRSAVAEQFGPESLTAWHWARGKDERPVEGRRCQSFTASHLFEVPEVRYEALLEVAARLAERALADLPVARPAWAVGRVAVQALTVEGDAWARDVALNASPGPETLRGVLGRLLAHLSGEGSGISELEVLLVGLEPAGGRQLQLFEAQESDRQWAQIVRQLSRKHSPDRLVHAEMIDPDAAILPQRYAFRAVQA